ncbi:Uncharacterised protein [Mycobacteroides abscessus subsp. abscessus]|nr:Uncharacterised protein [Mycobacteroides abscessus subsp. abscessus]
MSVSVLIESLHRVEHPHADRTYVCGPLLGESAEGVDERGLNVGHARRRPRNLIEPSPGGGVILPIAAGGAVARATDSWLA